MISQKKILNAKPKFTLLIIATIFILFVLSAYWLKSQLGINFFRSVTLSNYFPFNALAPHRVIYSPNPGIILHDSFDKFSLLGNWNKLWMREEGRVTKELDFNGINNTRCLLIKSTSQESWSISHNKYVKVKKGDTFNFTVSVKLNGENPSIYAGIAALDKKKEVISWNYITDKTKITSKWVILKKTIKIPDGISFIQFKLAGIGPGEYRIDDVIFVKNYFPTEKKI